MVNYTLIKLGGVKYFKNILLLIENRLQNNICSLSYFRIQQNQQRKKKLSRKRDNDNTFTTTDNDTDRFSIAATDIDDEFFDCSDSENNISDIENRSVY